MESFLSALYPLAAAIAGPVALASTTILLFFTLGFGVVKALGPALEKVVGKDAVRVLLVLLTYGFILAFTALVFAGLAWLTKESYEQIYLINEAEKHLEERNTSAALLKADQIIQEWPDAAIGYSIQGTAYFAAEKFEDAVNSFAEASRLSQGSDICGSRMKADISWSAALGEMGRNSEAMSLLTPYLDCEGLPRGVEFNLVKLYVQENRPEEAIALITDLELLTSTDRPDYRDRSFFLLAAALAIPKEPQDETLWRVKSALISAFCLNGDFARIALGISSAAAGSPEGNLMQTFSYEIDMVTVFLETHNMKEEIIQSFDLNNC